MKSDYLFFAAAAAQIAAFSFIGVTSYTAIYVPIGVALVGIVLLFRRRGFSGGWAAWAPLLSLALVGLTVPLQAVPAADALVLLALLPVALVPGLVLVLDLDNRLSSAAFLGASAFLGAALAALAGLNEYFAFGIPRPGVGNNPIHYADLALTLGFVSLLGLFGSNSQWRFVHLLGPVFGLVAVVISGSRGPLLSAVVLSLAVLPFIVWWFHRERGFLIAVALAVLSLPPLLIGAGLVGEGRALGVLRGAFDALLAGNLAAVDYVRIEMYHAGWIAFLNRPFTGHGFTGIYGAALPHMSAQVQSFGAFDNLHSDLVNFAVMSGVLGLLAYGLLLAAPFMALRQPMGRNAGRAVLLGAVILSVGYFTMGLTNTMFGILPQTGLYAAILANIIAMSRHGRASDLAEGTTRQ